MIALHCMMVVYHTCLIILLPCIHYKDTFIYVEEDVDGETAVMLADTGSSEHYRELGLVKIKQQLQYKNTLAASAQQLLNRYNSINQQEKVYKAAVCQTF